PVTVASVRDHLGSGSYSTISTHLAKWREANDNRKAPDYPDMPENVDKAFRQVWAMAWKNAQETIQAEREALAAARKQMEQEQRDMEAEITRLEGQEAAQGAEIKKTGDLLSEKEKALSEAKNAKHGLEIDNARLSERITNSETLHKSDLQRVEAIQKEISSLQSENALLIERLSQAGKNRESMAKAHNEKCIGLDHQLSDSKAALKALEKELSGSRKTVEEDQKSKVKTEEAAKKLELDNARLLERVDQSESRVGELKEELDKLHERLREVTAKPEKTTNKDEKRK
ncbi:MAG: DNA-binding protein, partial [Methyloprofundus sp.]|nr:DNA-binding protein [Methyloprofundus sp.]